MDVLFMFISFHSSLDGASQVPTAAAAGFSSASTAFSSFIYAASNIAQISLPLPLLKSTSSVSVTLVYSV